MSIEFDITGLSFIRDKKVAIDGRVLDEPIRVGSVFNVLTHRPQKYGGEKALERQDDPSRKLPDRGINVEVLKIEAYGKSFEEADTGLGCRLIVPIDDADKLGIGWILTIKTVPS